jgi:hypothetical protein
VKEGGLRVERGCKLGPSGYWTRKVLRLMVFWVGGDEREPLLACFSRM